MSTHLCTHCGHIENIFGEEGAQKLGIEILGKLPLDITIREHADRGEPIVHAMPESKISQIYKEIAKKIIQKIDRQQSLNAKLPKIDIRSS
jgi:ATP-binding protein involved in chromosome partitioning